MQRQSPLALVAAGLATSIVVWTGSSQAVEAGGGATAAAEIDTDGDFLPDVVEWVTLTNSTNPDTDGDANSDFVEVISGGAPRHESVALPPDQQMRVFVTGPEPGSADPRTWLHVFHRVMPTVSAGAGAGAIQSFATWLENPSLPGLQIPLNAFLVSSEAVYAERVTAEQGTWLQLSAPMVSESILQAVTPCTIWAESTVAGQQLQSVCTPLGIQPCQYRGPPDTAPTVRADVPQPWPDGWPPIVGENATQLGKSTEASGDFSTALGAHTVARGKYTTAMVRCCAV